jgi:hypothetical protein
MLGFAMAVAASVVSLAAAGVSAQPLADRKPADIGDAPVLIDGWRYVKGPSDLHIYVCDHPDCGPGSRLICHVYSSGSVALAPGQLRRDDKAASVMLQEDHAPGTFAGLRPDLATGRSHDVATAQDGTKKFYTFSMATGSKGHASLISSSSDEKKSEVNSERFEAAFKVVLR